MNSGLNNLPPGCSADDVDPGEPEVFYCSVCDRGTFDEEDLCGGVCDKCAMEDAEEDETYSRLP